MIEAVHPYLNFAGDTEEAFRFYQTVFGGELSITRFGDFPGDMGVPEGDRDMIANVTLPLGNGTMLMGTDTLASLGQELKKGNDFSIALAPSTADDAERLFGALSDGGTVEMPLAATPWAEKYGMCVDRFGVRWMVNYQGDVEFTGNGGE
jgi:PhnB protein